MFLKQCIRYDNHFLSLPIPPSKRNYVRYLSFCFSETFHPPLLFGPIALSGSARDHVISEDFLLSPVVGLPFLRSHGFLFLGLLSCLVNYYFFIKKA